MTQIPPTTSATGAPATGTTTLSSTSSLGKDDFLKLMMVQLQHQDPLQPSDPSQYLAQLAQFTSLEQQTNTAKSAAQSAAEQGTTAALSLLGHSVTYTDETTGATITGTVQKVNFTGTGPMLTIAGIGGISPGDVDEVT
jgi:flagellar basal-body rod modification protein FlgD